MARLRMLKPPGKLKQFPEFMSSRPCLTNELAHLSLRDQVRVAARPESSSGELVEKKIKGENPAAPDNDEISPGVPRRLTGAARYPLDPPAIAQFLRFCDWL